MDIESITCDPVFFVAINSALYQQNRPALNSFIDGPFIYIGPTVAPGVKGCFECLEERVLTNMRSHHNYVEFKKKTFSGYGSSRPEKFSTALRGLMQSITALEAIRFLRMGKKLHH